MRRPAPRGLHYQARIGERIAEVEVERIAADRYRVRVDGREIELDIREAEPGAYSVLLGTLAREADVQAGRAEDTYRVEFDGCTFEVGIADERRRRRNLVRGGSHLVSAGEVTAPMPGKIVKILVKPGDRVTAGHGVAVVEAMKMENELRAPRDGTVREVRVRIGQAVEIRETLLIIE